MFLQVFALLRLRLEISSFPASLLSTTIFVVGLWLTGLELKVSRSGVRSCGVPLESAIHCVVCLWLVDLEHKAHRTGAHNAVVSFESAVHSVVTQAIFVSTKGRSGSIEAGKNDASIERVGDGSTKGKVDLVKQGVGSIKKTIPSDYEIVDLLSMELFTEMQNIMQKTKLGAGCRILTCIEAALNVDLFCLRQQGGVQQRRRRLQDRVESGSGWADVACGCTLVGLALFESTSYSVEEQRCCLQECVEEHPPAAQIRMLLTSGAPSPLRSGCRLSPELAQYSPRSSEQ